MESNVDAKRETTFCRIGGIIACSVALAALFRPYFPKLLDLWISNPTYTHSPLIPFIVIYFIWEKRSLLRDIGAIPSFKGGLVALFISSLIWIVSVGGRSRFAIEFSFIILIISLVWINFGIKIMRVLSFPLLLLFMMIPLPEILYGSVSRNLQLLSSKFGVAFMQLFGVPVYREGNVIHLAQTTLQVAEACSGISSLVSLFTLAMIYAYISQKGFLRRLIMVLCAFPVAIFMNWVRIAATGMIAHYGSLEYAQGFYHSFSGWIVFVIAFLIFLSIGFIISHLFSENQSN